MDINKLKQFIKYIRQEDFSRATSLLLEMYNREHNETDIKDYLMYLLILDNITELPANLKEQLFSIGYDDIRVYDVDRSTNDVLLNAIKKKVTSNRLYEAYELIKDEGISKMSKQEYIAYLLLNIYGKYEDNAIKQIQIFLENNEYRKIVEYLKDGKYLISYYKTIIYLANVLISLDENKPIPVESFNEYGTLTDTYSFSNRFSDLYEMLNVTSIGNSALIIIRGLAKKICTHKNIDNNYLIDKSFKFLYSYILDGDFRKIEKYLDACIREPKKIFVKNIIALIMLKAIDPIKGFNEIMSLRVDNFDSLIFEYIRRMNSHAQNGDFPESILYLEMVLELSERFDMHIDLEGITEYLYKIKKHRGYINISGYDIVKEAYIRGNGIIKPFLNRETTMLSVEEINDYLTECESGNELMLIGPVTKTTANIFRVYASEKIDSIYFNVIVYENQKYVLLRRKIKSLENVDLLFLINNAKAAFIARDRELAVESWNQVLNSVSNPRAYIYDYLARAYLFNGNPRKSIECNRIAYFLTGEQKYKNIVEELEYELYSKEENAKKHYHE